MGRVARSIPMARPPADADEPCYWCGQPYGKHTDRPRREPAEPPSAPCKGLSLYYLRRAEGIARETQDTVEEKWRCKP